METISVCLQVSSLFSQLRKKSIRAVESTSWLSRQTKSKLMQKLATTKVCHLSPDLT